MIFRHGVGNLIEFWVLKTRPTRRAIAWACAYPKVLSYEKTLELVQRGYSISRYGDQEFMLMAGAIGGESQKYDAKLVRRLAEILKNGIDGHIAGIVNFFYIAQHGIQFFMNFGILARHIMDRLLPMFDTYRVHGDAAFTYRINRANISEFRKIWAGRKVVFVRPKNGRFVMDERLFGNIKERAFVDVPPVNAWSEYPRILRECRQFPPPTHTKK
jgi:hypothetical protein